MRRRIWGAAAAALMLGAAYAVAEDRPPQSPAPSAEAPPRAKPAAAPAAKSQDAASARNADALRQGVSDTPTAKPADRAAPDGRPGAVGRLIPPGEPIPDSAVSDAALPEGEVQNEPAVPLGPPAHSLLREDDFSFAACRLELARLGTVYTEEAPIIGEQRDCGIDRPLKVSEILPGVALEGGAMMRCNTARALGWWMRDFVQPAARRLPGAPQVASMSLGSTYQCRGTVGATTSGLSEHALGNAIDIGSFTFDDKTVLAVEATGEGNAMQGFLATVRWAGCMDFTTVLGPGSNAAHAGHLHLDIKQRRGGYRVCE